MALFTVVTMTSGAKPLRSAISAASRLSSLPCPTWWAYTWCALRGKWGKSANCCGNIWLIFLWKALERWVLIWFHENHCRTWKKVESCWAWCPKWGQILIASGFQTEDLNLEFSYIDANFTNTTGGDVFVGSVWTGFLQAFSVDWVLLNSISRSRNLKICEPRNPNYGLYCRVQHGLYMIIL